MLSGPIAAMVWEGREAVKTGRGAYPPRSFTLPFNSPRKTPLTRSIIVLLGATNPLASAPGTIRGDYAIV